MTNQENATLPEDMGHEEIADQTTVAQTAELAETEDQAASAVAAASEVAEGNLAGEQAEPVTEPTTEAADSENAAASEEPEPSLSEPIAEAESSEAEASLAEDSVAEDSQAEALAARVEEENLSEKQAQPVTVPMVEDRAPGVDASSDDGSDDDASSDDDGSDDSTSSDDESQRVVRMLAVGQKVNGVVRRITDFGAFVDIGVGRDGLIHISELSLQRVGKVSDVLSANQEVQPWIKKLDRKRNRISLTLISPEQKTIRDIEAGELVEGTVTRILPYGAFIDIGIGRDALLHVREMSNKFVEKPEDVVKVGETLEARIIEVSRRRGRVDLSLKGLRDEPEDEAVEQEVSVNEEIEEIEDEFADIEVLSPMELAFKRAVEAEGEEIQVGKRKGKRSRSREAKALQDEIIARTLDTSRK